MTGPTVPCRAGELGRYLEIQNLGLNLPFAVGFLLVAAGGLPSWRSTLLVAVAFVAARNAGHSFNRWADRGYDARNPRTRSRALVTGRYPPSFALAFAAAFVGLYLADNIPRSSPRATDPATDVSSGPRATALIIALGIGLQNLTEGLVFGGNWASGSVGVVAVVFVGFFLQNMTEGFPIASPFLGTNARRNVSLMVGLFLLGGIPTIVGGAFGYFWTNSLLLVIFDALAIGAIVYVILPMLRVAFRPLETRAASLARNRLVYAGILIGFIIGFAVNAI
ncbi:MAG: UbiA family prenyltransferase [Thermoplasmata archaeon]